MNPYYKEHYEAVRSQTPAMTAYRKSKETGNNKVRTEGFYLDGFVVCDVRSAVHLKKQETAVIEFGGEFIALVPVGPTINRKQFQVVWKFNNSTAAGLFSIKYNLQLKSIRRYLKYQTLTTL